MGNRDEDSGHRMCNNFSNSPMALYESLLVEQNRIIEHSAPQSVMLASGYKGTNMTEDLMSPLCKTMADNQERGRKTIADHQKTMADHQEKGWLADHREKGWETTADHREKGWETTADHREKGWETTADHREKGWEMTADHREKDWETMADCHKRWETMADH